MFKIFNRLNNIITSQAFRCLFALCSILLISGCDYVFEDASASQDGNFDGQASCWQTLIMQPVIQSIDTLYNMSKDKVANGAANVILLAFAIWLAFKLLKTLGSFKEENIGEVWTEIGQKLFICVVCAYFVGFGGASKVDEALQLTLIPLYQTLIELGSESLDAGKNSLDLGDYGIITFRTPFDKPTCPVSPISDLASMRTMIRDSSGCLVCAINDRLSSGIRIGIWMISTLNVLAMLIGFILIIIFSIAKLGFVLFTVDALFRINFAIYLIPVLVACVPFKYTRKWAKQGALMFLNSAGIMMFMGILVAISTGTLENMIDDYKSGLNEEGMEGLSMQLLGILMISLLLINIPAVAVSLADKFVEGGGGLEFQKRVTKFIVNTVKKFGRAAMDYLSQSASSSLNQAMEKYEKIREISDNIKQTKQAASNFMNSIAGYNDD